MVICDNFGNFGGFCVGHVELVAGNVVSLGSAALCGNELLASSCLENSGLTAELRIPWHSTPLMGCICSCPGVHLLSIFLG